MIHRPYSSVCGCAQFKNALLFLLAAAAAAATAAAAAASAAAVLVLFVLVAAVLVAVAPAAAPPVAPPALHGDGEGVLDLLVKAGPLGAVHQHRLLALHLFLDVRVSLEIKMRRN